MSVRKIARRYASAIFELAAESGAQGRVGEQLRAARKLIEGHSQLRSVYANPAVRPQSKQGIFEKLAPKLGLDNLTANSLRLMIRKGRIQYLGEVVEEYVALERRHHGVEIATVASSSELAAAQAESLRARLEEATGKEVELESRQDPSLIGGLVVRMGGTVYDGSIANQLRLLRRRLVED